MSICVFGVMRKDSSLILSSVEIKGGVTILFRDRNWRLEPIGPFARIPELRRIAARFEKAGEENSLMSIIHLQPRYDLDALYADYPERNA